jgi:hypothetical protein
MKNIAALLLAATAAFTAVAEEPFTPAPEFVLSAGNTITTNFINIVDGYKVDASADWKNQWPHSAGNWKFHGGWEPVWWKNYPVGWKYWEKDDIVGVIKDLDIQLASAGIELLMLYVPPRPCIYPEPVCPNGHTFLKDNFSYKPVSIPHAQLEWLSALRAADIDVLDLTEFLLANRGAVTDASTLSWEPNQLYALDDPHWSPLGAYVSAQVIRKHIENRPWYQSATKDYMQYSWITDSFGGILSGPKKAQLLTPVVSAKSGNDYTYLAGKSQVVIVGSSPVIWWGDGKNFEYQLSGAMGFPVKALATSSGSSWSKVNMLRSYASDANFKNNVKLVIVMLYCRAAGVGEVEDRWAGEWTKKDLGITWTGTRGPLNPPSSYAPWLKVDDPTPPQQTGKPLELVSPKGGDIYKVGQDLVVEWKADLKYVGNIMVELSLDEGVSWHTLNDAQGQPAADLKFTWKIADINTMFGTTVSPVCEKTLVRIRNYVDGGDEYEQVSAPFVIADGAGTALLGDIAGRRAPLMISRTPRQVAVRINTPGKHTVSFVNSLGGRVAQFYGNGAASYAIDRIGLAAGVYWLRANLNGRLQVHRVMLFR